MRYLEILEHEELTGIILSQTIIASVTVLYIFIYLFIHMRRGLMFTEKIHITHILSPQTVLFSAFYYYGVLDKLINIDYLLIYLLVTTA